MAGLRPRQFASCAVLLLLLKAACHCSIDFYWRSLSGVMPTLTALPVGAMKAETRWRLVRSSAAVLLALTAGALAPSRASASCGDYVVMGRHVQVLPPSAPKSDEPTPPPAQPPAPCTGPSCTTAPASPPITSAPPVNTTALEWACAMMRATLPDFGAGNRCCEAPVPRPIRGGSSVYHPPR